MNSALEFKPPAWLRNAHFQSIVPSLHWRRLFMRQRVQRMLAHAREHVLDCGDGVRLLGVHSTHPRAAGTAPRPLVMLLHGWEGSADALYLLSLGSYLFEQGFDVFRLNLRDHGPTHHLNEELFHSCRIAEVVGAVRAVQELVGPPSLDLAGFSLGGNFALRVAVRAPGASIRLRRVVAVCPVLSPRNTLAALENGWSLYERYFIRKWKRSLQIKARCFPRRYDLKEILRLDSLNAMTDVLVREHSEYADMESYLDGYAIVDNALADLQVRSHIILAADDPIIPAGDARRLAQSPQLSVNIVRHGGHCGFMDRLAAESWIDRTVVKLLRQEGAR